MDSESDFLDVLKKERVISIVGMAKGVGKTTTLNYIIKLCKGKCALGLSSIGQDGQDSKNQQITTRIYVEKGTIIATARTCVKNCDITREILKSTEIYTPLGNIIIIKALSCGFVELSGPSQTKLMQKIIEELLSLGSELVLIDGATNRKTVANPKITGATILVTGAEVSKNITEIIDNTVHEIRLLALEQETDSQIVEKSLELLEKSKVTIIYDDLTSYSIDTLTALDAAKEIKVGINKNTKYILIKGVLGTKTLKELTQSVEKWDNITFLVEDGTKVFLNKEAWASFQRKGGHIKVLNPIKLICVAINPSAKSGYNVEGNELIKLLQEKINIPIINVVSGG